MKFFSWFLLLLLCLQGCSAPAAPQLSDFAKGYEADVGGTVSGVSFGATVCAAPMAEGVQPLTVTFYAPHSLAGTVLLRGADGKSALCCGEVVFPVPEAMTPLLCLFPTAGDIAAVTKEEGKSTLSGAFGSVTFSAEGVPVAAKAGQVAVTVLSFSYRAP